MRFTTAILLIILFTWGEISCTKEGGNLYLEGRVYNPLTGNGIKGVEIYMFRNKTLSGYPPDSKEVERAITDENGYYSLSHAGGAWSYWIVLDTEPNDIGSDYYLIGWSNSENIDIDGSTSRFQLPKGENVKADFQMVPFGEYKFNIKNTNCQNQYDNIKIIYLGGDIEDEDSRVGEVRIDLDGCVDILGDIWKKHPMGNKYFRREVTKNGVTETFYDTVYIPPGEQVVYNVFY